MPKRIAVATVLLVCAFALGAEEARYQIDLVPSGKLISRDLPALKGTTYLFHQYPTGTLISVRKSTVKQITKLSPAAAAAVNPTQIVPIRDLAFQGPKSGSSGGRYTNIDRARGAAAAANAGTAGRTASPD
ncbi:MAG TPA: hypothetical protein VGQ75_11230 [Thermoanaerobaculia bacterium]|jgi:hypothetical protein|nr:hypothetical protein [Thermoanaerobaculia bacterium]